MNLRFSPAFAALFLAVAAPAVAQEELPSVFTETIDVRVVNIEVVVTDKKGERVTGLAQEDFLLKVDGKEVSLDYFTEVREGTAAAVGEGGQGAPGTQQGAKVRTNYLVFIDDFFSVARDRDRVLEALETDLAQLQDGDRIAMVGYDGKQLEMLTSWTNDPNDLQTAFRRARGRQAYGLARLGELRAADIERQERQNLQADMTFRTDGAFQNNFLETQLDSQDRAFATRIETQVERAVLAAVSALRSFSSPEGRRVLLLLSGGWPVSPAEYAVNHLGANPEEVYAGSLDQTFKSQSQLFSPLSDTANLLGYTIYPVDVPGFFRDTATAAEFAGPRGNSPPPGGFGPSARIPRELIIHDGYTLLAKATGGQPLINALRDRSLAETVADTRTFYWLGFTPVRLDDDARHDIEIEIRGRPDLRVRAREGFVDLSRSTEVTMIVESALLFGDPPSTVPLGTKFGRPRRSGVGKMKVPLEVGIPMDEITLLPTQGRFVNEVEVRVTVMDEEGNRSQTQVDKVTIAGSKPPQPGQRFFYETELTLRRRNHRIVVAVYDPLSQVILSSTGDIGPKAGR
ncbi:MAG: VWA domain-containing protein [Acidobacteriota bacterium]